MAVFGMGIITHEKLKSSKPMQITGILRLRATASCERDEKDTARLAQPGWRTYIFWDL